MKPYFLRFGNDSSDTIFVVHFPWNYLWADYLMWARYLQAKVPLVMFQISMENRFSIIRMRSTALSKSLKRVWNCSCRWVITVTRTSVGDFLLFSSLNLLQLVKLIKYNFVGCLWIEINFISFHSYAESCQSEKLVS